MTMNQFVKAKCRNTLEIELSLIQILIIDLPI